MRTSRVTRVVTAALTTALSAAALAVAGAAVAAHAEPGSVAATPARKAVTVAAAAVTLPPSGRWDYQIGGGTTYIPAPAVVSRDNADQPYPGVYSICYVNAFQSQPGDSSLKSLWLVVNGKNVEDPEWKGEYMLDTKGHRSQLVAAFTTLLQKCAAKGFKAVEFDNLDSYDRSKGGLTQADNIAYAKDLITATHGLGLAAAQKNAAELVGSIPFDFAVAESCLRWSECGDYTAGYRVVLDVEYQEELSASSFQKKCATAVKAGKAPSFVFRDREVTPNGVRAWCTAQS